jgi:hypothetical protein
LTASVRTLPEGRVTVIGTHWRLCLAGIPSALSASNPGLFAKQDLRI